MSEHTSEPYVPLPPDEPRGWADDEPCPDCNAPWALGALSCERCGLTMAEIAERLAR